MGETEKDNVIYHNDIPIDVKQWNDNIKIESNIETPKQSEYHCKIKKESYEHYVLRKFKESRG